MMSFSLTIINYHVMKMHRGVKVQLHAFLISALEGGELSVSCPTHFTPREGAPDTNWIGDRVGPRAGLDTVEEGEISCPCCDSNPDSMAIQPTAHRYTNQEAKQTLNSHATIHF
jgi:hypothetical protein